MNYDRLRRCKYDASAHPVVGAVRRTVMVNAIHSPAVRAAMAAEMRRWRAIQGNGIRRCVADWRKLIGGAK